MKVFQRIKGVNNEVLHDPTKFDYDRCTHCGQTKPREVEERYSHGLYVGRLCEECCYKYRDHCGLDRPQGDLD